jgi:hypothetical protein
MVEEMVRVYDFTTKKLFTIPERELAPGMVRARVAGIDGEVWVAAETLKDSDYRHPPFPEDVRALIRRLHEVFKDVYPQTVEEWEDGFRRDQHPEREIAIWQRMADIYTHFTEGRSLNSDQKKDIFQVILACVNNGPRHVLTTTNPRTLSRKRVKEIIDYFQRS